METISDAEVERLRQKKAARISGYDWKAWEKFDVDAEMEKIDAGSSLRFRGGGQSMLVEPEDLELKWTQAETDKHILEASASLSLFL